MKLKPTALALSLITSLTLYSVASSEVSAQSNQLKNNAIKTTPKKSNQVPTEIITIGNDALLNFSAAERQALGIKTLSASSKNPQDVVMVSLPADKLDRLSQLMHDQHRRCGGYIWHPSSASAEKHLRAVAQVKHAQKANLLVEYTIDNDATVAELLGQIDPTNLASVVTSMGAYNNRYYTASSGVESAQWLKDHWQTITSTRDDISVEFFYHDNWDQPSVVATITGETLADEVVVIGGHLDSINSSSSNREAARAPGFDDNASGIAVITETLRAMVVSGYKPARTVKVMGYAAEEVGLRGSSDIAQFHVNNNIDVVGAAQFDMTGYKAPSAKDIVFMTDYTNAEQNQFMYDLLDHYYPEIDYATDTCGYACSDHASWHVNGYAASMPFESYSSDYNSDIHTTGDDHFNATHATNFLRLSIAYVAELAKGSADPDNYESRSTVEFTESSAILTEGQTINVRLQRTGLFDREASVSYQTVDGSAVAGTEYVAASGTVTWAVNDSSDKIIQIQALETDENKSFSLELTSADGNAELGSVNKIDIDLQNDSKSSFNFWQPEVNVDESSTVLIAIQRTGELDEPASVRFRTVNGTAIAGVNYVANTGTLSWGIGEGDDRGIEIDTLNVDERESFTVELEVVSGNAVLGETNKISVNIINRSGGGNQGGSGGGGGSLGFAALLMLLGLRRRRQ
ncbi:MAG: M20/M25/M40 family metallo-hydrolase [Gammaproteobacteria bacterium]|nr:M20/M25/M40 family metallo-hydrolase [Gammaproteobacteria bacterium]